MAVRDSIFISYSHENSVWAERFQGMLEAEPSVRIFSDAEITQGEDWEKRLQGELARARIALLLVSPAFVNSEYVKNRELPWIIKERGSGLILNWVEVEPAIVPEVLKEYQALKVHSDNRSLSQLVGGDRDAEIKKICEQLIEDVKQQPRIPRWHFFNRVSEVVQRRFGYHVRKEIAVGDHSVVYLADAPGRRVVVKAKAGRLKDERELRSLADKLEKAKDLEHPSFIRLLDWSLESEPLILVTDFAGFARPLGRMMEKSPEALDVGRVRFVLQKIAEALSKYHEAGLIYGNVRPSDVLISKSGDGSWNPRISAYRASQISLLTDQLANRFVLNQERLTYVGVEQYENYVATRKSDQYALGLLAIEMLQGEPPVVVKNLVDLESKTAFFKDPRAFGGVWLDRSPELAEIVLRMLDPNPRKRFQSMGKVASALGCGATVEANNRRLAKQSFLRATRKRKKFYRSFYRNLFADRKDLEAKFPAGHDWKLQYASLDSAVCKLLNFSDAFGQDEPTILTRTASRHQEYQLTKDDFAVFEEALIATLSQFGEASEEVQAAWRQCLAPGMRYMKERAGVDAT